MTGVKSAGAQRIDHPRGSTKGNGTLLPASSAMCPRGRACRGRSKHEELPLVAPMAPFSSGPAPANLTRRPNLSESSTDTTPVSSASSRKYAISRILVGLRGPLLQLCAGAGMIEDEDLRPAAAPPDQAGTSLQPWRWVRLSRHPLWGRPLPLPAGQNPSGVYGQREGDGLRSDRRGVDSRFLH